MEDTADIAGEGKDEGRGRRGILLYPYSIASIDETKHLFTTFQGVYHIVSLSLPGAEL